MTFVVACTLCRACMQSTCSSKAAVVIGYSCRCHGDCRAHAHYNHLHRCLVHSHAFLTQKGMTVAATHLHLVVYATDSDRHSQHLLEHLQLHDAVQTYLPFCSLDTAGTGLCGQEQVPPHRLAPRLQNHACDASYDQDWYHDCLHLS